MSDSRISKKILSEICGHDIGNLNVGSIGNLGEFAIKSLPLVREVANIVGRRDIS